MKTTERIAPVKPCGGICDSNGFCMNRCFAPSTPGASLSKEEKRLMSEARKEMFRPVKRAVSTVNMSM